MPSRFSADIDAVINAGLAFLLGEPVVSPIEEIVSHASGVGQQHAGRDVALWCTQTRLPLGSKPSMTFNLLILGDIGLSRHIEVELAFLYKLQCRCTYDRFGRRKDREDAIRRHRCVAISSRRAIRVGGQSELKDSAARLVGVRPQKPAVVIDDGPADR